MEKKKKDKIFTRKRAAMYSGSVVYFILINKC